MRYGKIYDLLTGIYYFICMRYDKKYDSLLAID